MQTQHFGMNSQPSLILLKQIDQDLVDLEQRRADQALLRKVVQNLEELTLSMSDQYQTTSQISKAMCHLLQEALDGRLMLASTLFEPLFHAMTLFQEQLENSTAGKEVVNSLSTHILSRLQSFSPIKVTALASATVEKTTTLAAQPVAHLHAPGLRQDALDGLSGTSSKLLKLMNELEEVTYAGDLEAIRDHLKDCIVLCETVNDVVNPAKTDQELSSLKAILNEMQTLVTHRSDMLGKKVKITTQGDDTVVSPSLLPVLRKSILQFSQYLLEESIETTGTRRSKKAENQIFVGIHFENGFLFVGVSDDGKGFRPENLKKRATERGVIAASKLSNATPLELCQLIFHEGMFSLEDAEIGASLKDLKREIEEVDGAIGLENYPDEMAAFCLAFPMKKEPAFVDAISSLASQTNIQQNFSAEMQSLQTSAGAISSIVEGLHKHLSREEISDLENHLHQIFDGMKILIGGLSHGDINQAKQASLTLSQMANVDLFKEVGMMAREMHENLKDFSSMLDTQFQDMALEKIPDAANRLEHIIEMTENSANTTLDLSESILMDCGETQADLDTLITLLKDIKQSQSPTALEECLQIVNFMKNRELEVNEKIVGIMTAQDYQDRTGQVIKKIIVLVNDLEKRMVKLIQTFGSSLLEQAQNQQGGGSAAAPASATAAVKPEVKDTTTVDPKTLLEKVPDNVEMYGPQHKAGKGMTNQDDVDSLLAQFGF